MCFQLLNVTSPNAPENTCVISIFEAPDSYTNLKIALSRHIDDSYSGKANMEVS